MDVKKAFGVTLKKLRTDKGWSQERFALEAEIARSYMSDMERGLSEPGLAMIFRICEVLQIKPSEFIKKMEKRTDR
jgi:transcriptional regulator with XRE-family HTH domain